MESRSFALATAALRARAKEIRRSRRGLRLTASSLLAASLAAIPATARAQCAASCVPLVNYAVGSLPIGVATGDFNSDGSLDLAVANAATNNVSILLGNPNGTFQPTVNYPAGANCHYLSVSDLDANGTLDLAVANYDGGTVSILLGNGDGTFQAHVDYAVGFGAQFPAVGDFNLDGRLDLAVSSFANDDVSILLGNGNGTFQAGVHYATANAPVGVAVGDFNADGKPDLAVANYHEQTDGSVSILLGNGDGTLQAAADYSVGGSISAISVVVGDFNADGHSDLATANWISGTVSILLGIGDGTFQAAVNYPVCPYPSYIALGDFDADGKVDLTVTNAYGSNSVSFLLGNGDGTFRAAVNYTVGNTPFSVAVGDFDGDGKPDLATANFYGNNVSVLLSTALFHPLEANAGADQTRDEGTPVTLDGSQSVAPNGGTLVFVWTQVAGPSVTLNLTDPAHPTFVAPVVAWGGETLTFRLVVTDGCHLPSEPDIVNVTVANVNHPPVALADDDQAVYELSPVSLNGSNSFDDDGDPLTYSWMQTAGPAVTLNLTDPVHPTFAAPLVSSAGATLTFQLTVDDSWATDSDSVSVLVENVNHPPDADAGLDQTRNEGAAVNLDGTASSDPDGDALSYSWVQIGGPTVILANTASSIPSFTAPQVGAAGATLVFRLTVNDGYSGTDTDEVSILVQDTNATPVCSLARPSIGELWPPNHKMVCISILGVTDPDNDHVTITILGVTQDEPINGLGDGDTAPDAVTQGSTVLLRSERSGLGNGRVYRITFRADDGIGGQCIGQVSVCVPHDQGRNSPGCVDDGGIFNSLIP